MTHLVRGEVVEHERRCENESPGKRQHAGIRARAPTARLVAHANALDGDAELGGVAPARGLEIALRLAFEEVAGAAVDVRRPAGGAKHPRAPLLGLRPPPAPRPPPLDPSLWFS